VGRPVKVSDELYSALRAEAIAKGIAVQDALRQRMARHEEKGKQLEGQCRSLQAELARREGELEALARTEGTSRSMLSQRTKELQDLRTQLSATQAERDELDEEADDLRYETETRAEEVERLRSRLNTLLVIGLLVVAGVLIYRMWSARRQETPLEPVPEVVPPASPPLSPFGC